MTKRIFRSIVFAELAVLLAAVGLIVGVVHSYFTQVQRSQLRVETALAAHAVANEGIGYFHKLDGTMDCRITWIAADGTVLYDNRSDTGAMENHLAREEVVEALQTGYGESTRYSDTLLQRSVYAAERLPDGTVLRLSVTRQTLLQLVADTLWPIMLILAAAAALSMWLASRLSRQIVRPLNALDLDAPLENRTYPEIRPLLQRLDTQQKQLRSQRQELARRQREFHTVTRSLPEGLVLLSTGGTVLSINPAAAELLAVTPNCIGADFSVANRNRTVAALVDRAFTGIRAEQTVDLGDGQYLAAARPVRTEGQLSGVVLLLLDMTQKQKAEALRREFTANVSHELKTPLHAISGYAELLKSGLVEQEDCLSFYEKIYAEAQRLITLVEDILRLSRLDEGAADMQWVDINLKETARQTARELAAAAELAEVTLEVRGDAGVLTGIPQLVSAVVFNLTDNAIKYNRPGGQVLLEIRETSGRVILTVTDTGMGIPEESRERIFERFYRGDKSHSKAVGGTGLGLSIVKHAVQILHGELRLESTPGTGTAITVEFPGKKEKPAL